MARLKLKGKKKKKNYKIIVLMLMILAVFGIYTFFKNLIKSNESIVMNKTVLTFLIKDSIHLSENSIDIPQNLIKSVGNFDIKKPNTILTGTLANFVNLEEGVTESHEEESASDLSKLEKISSYVYDPNPKEITDPIIYIYNTHQLENYSNQNLENYNIKPTVMMASFLLREKLIQKGVPSVVETMNVTEFLKISNWNYDDSYKASRIFALDAKSKYSTLKYYIDLHRDSASKEATTATIDGKSYAKLLFVVGTNHEKYKENLNLANKVKLMFDEEYPGLTRSVMQKGGASIRGIYNQDISTNSMLFEVGGPDNTFEEVLNTIEAISEVLTKLVKE